MNFFISTNCLLKRLHKVTADAFQAVRIYFILSIGLFSVFTSLGQGFQPIATSGYNFDAIAETFPNAVTTTTAAMDLSNFVMFSQAFGTAAGIGNGILNSGTIVNGSNTYQLMPFDGNNALRLTPGVNNGTLVLQTPASFSQLSVLGFATEGNSNISVTVNYTDATTNTFGPFLLNDWFFAAGFAYSGHGRITRVAGAPYNLGGIPGNPRMYPINFNIPCASQQKLVASVVINHNSGTNTFIMALSGVGSGTMTAPGNQSVCAGQLTTPVNFSGTAGTTYTWTNNNTGIGLSAGGSGNIPAFTAVNSGSSPVTATITVTPTFAGCAGTPQTFTITVTPGTTPTFASPGSFCSGSVIPPLPTTSQNGISGTWSPAINNTVTTTYTFTPTPGQCASSTQLTIAIGQDILPTFATVGPFCSGASIPALPTSSQNSITGTWSPVINNTATTTYTFTPTAGQCASSVQTTIVITPNVLPTFSAVGPFCQGATIPNLPTTSQNGISGTWSPAINNQSTTTYTFTPSAGQCASTAQMTITITSTVTPTFAAQGPFCVGTNIPALPTTSQNGISGTWSPAINNQTTTTYTFTPSAGQCASTAQMTITITPTVTPTFAAQGPFCVGTNIPALPTTSQNGISGTWSPAINNQSTTTYTFTPNGGQCASTAQLTVVINLLVTPTFAAPGSFCQGAVIPNLPTTSQNNINGTWTPNINNQQTTTYNFNPNAGQCANSTQLTIAVTPNVTPTFPTNMMYCEGAVIPPLPTVSNNGIDGTWAPPINNQSTTNYTFTPVSTACAVPVNSTIVVNSPSFSTTALSVCQNILPYAWNGLSISASGQYQAILQNALGCDSVATLILNVVPVPVHVINLELCENQLPFVWQGLTLSQSGSTTVNILSSLGCDSLVTLNLLVRPLPSVAFNAQSVQGCAPLEVTFFNNSSLATNCQWDLGNGTIINSCGSVSTFYQGVGCYDVRLTITDPFGCTNSLLQTGIICVEPKPHASFTVSPNPLPAHNPVAQFTNTSQGHSTQIWNFGNNQGGSSVEHPTHAYPDVLGNYVVTLVVANENGCLDSTSQWVVVENSVIYYVPNTFTPDGDLLMNPSNPYLPRVLISMCII